MVAKQAKSARLDFVVAGRDAKKLAAIGDELGASYHVFTLDKSANGSNAIHGVKVVELRRTARLNGPR